MTRLDAYMTYYSDYYYYYGECSEEVC